MACRALPGVRPAALGRGPTGRRFSAAALTAALAVGLCGCALRVPSGGDFPDFIRSGFDSRHKRLYLSRTRWNPYDKLDELLEHLGYDPQEFGGAIDHASDGRSLRLWDAHRTRAILIGKGRRPRLVQAPAGAALNDDNEVIDFVPPERIALPDGRSIQPPGYCIDATQTYFCAGGAYFEYDRPGTGRTPLVVCAVAEPAKARAVSALTGARDSIYATEQRVYLVTRESGASDNGEGRVGCEIYRRRPADLQLQRRFEIRSPARFTSFVYVEDFNPVGGQFLLRVERKARLPSLRYVYDIATGQCDRVGHVRGYAGFLDPGIFDAALRKPSSGAAPARATGQPRARPQAASRPVGAPRRRPSWDELQGR